MTTTPTEHAALVRRFISDVIAGGDTAAVDTFLDDDVADHNLVFGDVTGQEDLTAFGWRVLAAADVDVAIDDLMATDERVAVRATVSGIHRESLMDPAPTGSSFDIAYVRFCRVDDGRVADITSFPDGLGLLPQLDALPESFVNRIQFTHGVTR